MRQRQHQSIFTVSGPSASALLCRAVFAAGVGYGGDGPFAVDLGHIEKVGAAVVDFAIDVKVEGRPNDGEVVVDLDDRVVDAFFDCGFARLAYAVGEGFKGHDGGLAVAHEDHGAAGHSRRLDGGGVAVGHAVEHGVDGGEDGVFFRGGGEERNRERAKTEHEMEGGDNGLLHG